MRSRNGRGYAGRKSKRLPEGPLTFFRPTISRLRRKATDGKDGFRTNMWVRPFSPDPSYTPNLTLAELQPDVP
jgi:hypothetical protein